jgi:hypothetical protein
MRIKKFKNKTERKKEIIIFIDDFYFKIKVNNNKKIEKNLIKKKIINFENLEIEIKKRI